jgi:hypothetical protein
MTLAAIASCIARALTSHGYTSFCSALDVTVAYTGMPGYVGSRSTIESHWLVGG